MRTLFFAITAALGLAYARLAGGPMDGTQWDVKIKSDSFFSWSRHDTLVFNRGQVSILGDGESFPPAVYSAQNLDSAAADTIWNASLPQGQGVMTWHGLVRGDTIEGEAVLWTKDGKPKRYLFKGSRRA